MIDRKKCYTMTLLPHQEEFLEKEGQAGISRAFTMRSALQDYMDKRKQTDGGKEIS